MEIFFFLAMTLCALFSFCFGLRWFFSKGLPQYALMVIFGSGCAMLGRMFETLLFLIRQEIQGGFHVGMLGIMGSFLFFLAANYGTIDSLVDDGSKNFRKYRLIALSAPALVFAIFMLYLRHVGIAPEVIMNSLLTVVIMFASYYHMKHLIIPDVEQGFIGYIRRYNLLALIYAFLCMHEIAFTVNYAPQVVQHGIYVAFCVIYVLFIPALYKGVKQWQSTI